MWNRFQVSRKKKQRKNGTTSVTSSGVFVINFTDLTYFTPFPSVPFTEFAEVNVTLDSM